MIFEEKKATLLQLYKKFEQFRDKYEITNLLVIVDHLDTMAR